MNKRLILVDYKDNKKEFDVPNFENVLSIVVKVVSGDEVATILYRNGDVEEYDSSDNRTIDHFDCLYLIPLDKIEEFNNLQGDSYGRAKTMLSLLGEE